MASNTELDFICPQNIIYTDINKAIKMKRALKGIFVHN
jgi:hypothetical protein